MKTTDKFMKCKKVIEAKYPFVLSLIVTALTFFWLSNLSDFHEITKKLLSDSMLTLIVTIESALFGFLLTILALIFQMNNKMIDIIKQFGRFNQLVKFSKIAVYTSLVTVILSLVIILFINPETNIFISKGFKYLFGFFLIYNSLSTIRFVNIFYMIAKSK